MESAIKELFEASTNELLEIDNCNNSSTELMHTCSARSRLGQCPSN